MTPVRALVLIAAVGTAACGDDAPYVCRVVERGPDVLTSELPDSPDVLNAAVCDVVPGFGGYRADFVAHTFTVLLVEPNEADAEAARAALAESYQRPEIVSFALSWAATEFDYLTLRRFYSRSFGIFGIDGVASTDLDESRGKLAFGVVNDDAGACVRKNLLAMDIPESAFVIEPGEYVQPL